MLLVLLAIALSIDACVVAFTQGLACGKSVKIKNVLILALTLGMFHLCMPVIGYWSGKTVISFVELYSKWLVFAIFLFLGLKFIKEAFKEDKPCKVGFSRRYLFSIGIATSIDTLAAGLGLAFSGHKILLPAALISMTAFSFTILGFYCGAVLKRFPAKYLEIAAGVVLILLALKSLSRFG